MKKKLLIIDETIFKDVKKRYRKGAAALLSDSRFIRLVLEDLATKLNRG